jgi:hypothetical protein
MPTSPKRGSGGAPLLRDYLVANQQQGAQQAQGMAQYLGQEQSGARSQVDAAEKAITAQRLQPAYGTIGQVGGTVPGVGGPATPSVEMAGKVLEGPRVEMSETEPGRAAVSQVGRASAMGQLATTPAGMATINAQRYGMGAPRTSGGSMLDAAATNYGGGGQVRQQARQGAGLRAHLTGAVDRGNTAAEAQARQWIAAGTPPPADPTLTPPRAGSQPGRPTLPEGAGQPPRTREWIRRRKEDDFDSGGG